HTQTHAHTHTHTNPHTNPHTHTHIISRDLHHNTCIIYVHTHTHTHTHLLLHTHTYTHRTTHSLRAPKPLRHSMTSQSSTTRLMVLPKKVVQFRSDILCGLCKT